MYIQRGLMAQLRREVKLIHAQIKEIDQRRIVAGRNIYMYIYICEYAYIYMGVCKLMYVNTYMRIFKYRYSYVYIHEPTLMRP